MKCERLTMWTWLAKRKPIHYRFFKDLGLVCALFLFIGLCGTIYSFYIWIVNGTPVYEIVLKSLDIITFGVPPLLPAGLTAATAHAQRRLKRRKIFCLSSKHIILAGGLDVVCLDKVPFFFFFFFLQ